MSDQIFQNTIILNSSDKIFGDINNFIVEIPKTTKIEKIQLEKIRIPYTYYNVTEYNNKFIFEDNLNNNIAVEIPVGNYGTSEIISAVKLAMDNAPLSTQIFFCTLNDLTKKVSITSTLNFSLNFSIANSLGPLIGFGKNNYLPNKTTSYISPGILNLSYNNTHINVYSKTLTRHSDRNITSDNKSYFVSVQNDVNFGQYITYEPQQNNIFNFIDTATLQNIDFKFESPQHDDIDFNQVDSIQVTLKIYTK